LDKKISQNFLAIFLLNFVSLMILTACSEQDLGIRRAQQAEETNDNIQLGFVWPFAQDYDLLPEGVVLAVEEINANGGLLDGRPLTIIQKDDDDSVHDGRLIAQEFAEDPNITAVIGHAWSYISIPASPIYEFNDLIMLSPSSTSPELTDRGFKYIFRNVASDREVGRQLANFAKNQGYNRIAVLYVNESYGLELSNIFENEADKLEMQVVDRRNYLTERNFDLILEKWSEMEFDVIFIAGNSRAASFIKLAREKGIDTPIIGSDGLDVSDLWNIAGETANGVIVASHFHKDNPRSEQQDFIDRFTERWDTPPDTWAAQGYDAVYVLAYAIEQANSTIPAEVMQALHNTQNWQGVTGPHSFDANGDVIDKPIILKILQDGEFEFLQLATE
jgi:branched-chain amino acid transport system substrate-binding protein